MNPKKYYQRINLKDLYQNIDNKEILGYNEYSREEFLTSFLNNDSDLGDLKL